MQIFNTKYIPSKCNNHKSSQSQNRQAVYFGVTAFLTGWFISGVGEVLMSRVMHSLLDNLTENTLPLLKQSPLFAQGKQRLELAQILVLESESKGSNHEHLIKEYLKAAEYRFADASTEVDLSAMKAECFRYAALCAKLSGSPQSIIRDYATKALFHHQKGEKELKKLIKPSSWAMDLLKVITWPLSYPLIVGSMVLQNQPVQRLSDYTQKLLFPSHPQQIAIWQQIDAHQQSDLPIVCSALINNTHVDLKNNSGER